MEIVLFHLSSFFAISGQANVVRALIELGAKVDAVDTTQRTPLHRAAFEGISYAHFPQ